MATASKAATKTTAGASAKKAASSGARKSARSSAGKTDRKPNAAFMKALKPSAELAAVVGDEPLPRTEVVRKVWDYIKKHDLQDPNNRREINADAKLEPLFGKPRVDMFEMTRLINKHLQ